ncbi:hypothetical protein QBC39DRAFT_22474 [Podospora conica]|nr:hypothetical protein QBC39DRAFT_22474 [Schizothecium conicum]
MGQEDGNVHRPSNDSSARYASWARCRSAPRASTRETRSSKPAWLESSALRAASKEARAPLTLHLFDTLLDSCGGALAGWRRATSQRWSAVVRDTRMWRASSVSRRSLRLMALPCMAQWDTSISSGRRRGCPGDRRSAAGTSTVPGDSSTWGSRRGAWHSRRSETRCRDGGHRACRGPGRCAGRADGRSARPARCRSDCSDC